MAKLFAAIAAMALALSFSACKNDDFEMTKPSEIAVSNLSAEVRYGYTKEGYRYGEVNLTWFYDSADPAEYLVICRTDNSDEIHTIDSGSLESFKTHSKTDSGRNPGKYTYTVYTVGSGCSTSASASVTVNLEIPNYTGGNGGSSGGSSDGSGSNGSSVQEHAIYKYEISGMTVMTFEFRSDGTCIMQSVDGSSSNEGTYTGNAAKDGTITISLNGYPTADFKITNGKLFFGGTDFVRN